MLSLAIILPLLNAQIDQPITEKTVDVLGLIGFKQGETMIPINGTSIPLNVNDTVWLLALSDLSLEYGPIDRNIMNNVKVSAGKEIPLKPHMIKCCDTAKIPNKNYITIIFSFWKLRGSQLTIRR